MHILVHDGKQVVSLRQECGVLSTIHPVLRGSLAECVAEVRRLGLTWDENALDADAAAAITLPEKVQQTEAERLAAQAADLYAVAACAAAVGEVLQAVGALIALGVDTSDWSFQGVCQAAQAKSRILEVFQRIDLMIAALALRTAWDRLVFHTGDLRTADALWPYFYELAAKNGG